MMKLRILAVAALMAACGAVTIGAGSAGAATNPLSFTDGSATASASGLAMSWKQQGHEPGAIVTNYLAWRVPFALWLSPWVYVTYPNGYSRWRHSYATNWVGPQFSALTATADANGVAHFSHRISVPWSGGILGTYGRDQVTLAKITYRVGVTDAPTTVWMHYFRNGPFPPSNPFVWRNPDAQWSPPRTAP